MRFAFVCLLVASISGTFWGVAACSSHTADVPSSSDEASAPDSSMDVVPADTEKVVVTDKGGFPPLQSGASTCRAADSTFTLVLSSRQLTWKSCSPIRTGGGDASDVWGFVEGQKTLTEPEYAPVSAALHALELSSRERCGLDKPTATVDVTTPRGTVTYLDDFYACQKRGTYVSGMDALIEQFYRLTSSSR